jgi:hypothetical protein
VEAAVKRTARRAGFLYLCLIPLGVFSFVYVPSVLFVRGDAAATSRNIAASEALFRGGAVSHLLSQILVVFVALSLYRLLEPVNRNRAVVMVVLALLGLPISFLNEVHNLAALRVLDGGSNAAFGPEQRQAQAMLFLDMARNGIFVAQVFWGLWLLPLGSLVFNSGFMPGILGVPPIVAGAGYLFDSFAQLLFPGSVAVSISKFTSGAELLLPLWLVTKGVSAGDRPEPASQTARRNL